MPDWEELQDFLNPDDFATLAEREGKPPFPLILEEQAMSRELGTYDLKAADPWATARESDIKGMRKRDRLAISGVTYWLTHDPYPDGTGLATLRLSRTHPGDERRGYPPF